MSPTRRTKNLIDPVSREPIPLQRVKKLLEEKYPKAEVTLTFFENSTMGNTYATGDINLTIPGDKGEDNNYHKQICYRPRTRNTDYIMYACANARRRRYHKNVTNEEAKFFSKNPHKIVKHIEGLVMVWDIARKEKMAEKQKAKDTYDKVVNLLGVRVEKQNQFDELFIQVYERNQAKITFTNGHSTKLQGQLTGTLLPVADITEENTYLNLCSISGEVTISEFRQLCELLGTSINAVKEKIGTKDK